MTTLQDFLSTGVLAFMLTFTRMGTAIMIMPGLGDSFTPDKIRLQIALGISFVFFPLIAPQIPHPFPGTFMLIYLIGTEFMIGAFFGMISRILMMALDTAGMLISSASGFATAQMFNPLLATQGSLIGAFMSVTGIVILFATNMHHLLITGLIESYQLFPLGVMPDSGDMAQMIAKTVAESFAIGVKLGAPFIVMTFVLYIGMGALSRLMPQMQIFMITLPLQIFISLVIIMMTLSAVYLYWAAQFDQDMTFFLSNAHSG